MLVLTLVVGKRLMIGTDVVIQLLAVNGRKIRLGIKAPRSVPVLREELLLTPEARVREPERQE